MTVYTLFNQAQTTSTAVAASALTVTTYFTMSQTAALTGIWFYSPASATTLPAQCGVFAVSGQSLVASNVSPSWSGAAGSGWVKCSFNGSVNLTSGASYVVAVFLGSTTCDAKQAVFWTTGPGGSGFSNAAMSAPNFSTQSLQGAVQSGNPGLAYPTVTEAGSWYGPDVEVTVSGGPTPPPLIMSLFP